MAERVPRYFRGQAPPPPPPPPPPPGSTSAVPGQQPYAFGYNYGRGYQQSGISASTVPVAPSYSTHPVKKNTEADDSPLRKSTNELEINQTTAKTEEKTGQKCLPTMTTTTKPPNIWTCKACNITLESEKAFKGHRKSHVKCSDCPFEGSPKIVKAHYQAKHGKFSGSGFKTVTVAVPGCRVQRFKICVGNRPEDIQKWIEERKKRFPRSQASTSKNNPNADSKTAATPPTDKKQESSVTGLSSLLAGYGSSDDDDSDNDEKGETSNTIKSPATSLAPTVQDSNQGEDKTETANTTEIEPNNQCTPTSPTEQKPKINRPCRFFFRNGSCRNGDSCRFSHEVQARNQNRSSAGRVAQNKTSSNNARKRKRGGHTSSDTLLRRLLQNDMDRESTLSMQLLKFIVDNNFFLDEDSQTTEKRQRKLTCKDEPI